MIKYPNLKEVVESINSSPGWGGYGKGHDDCEAQGLPSDLGFDPIPVIIVTYYPFCDCGEPVLERQENMAEPPLVIMGYEYMETCYECAVVSSD